MFPTYLDWLNAAKAATPAHAPTRPATRTAPTLPTTPLPALVIGAGPAGLSAMAELAARSVPFVCLEASVDVGGMWDVAHNPASPVYPSLYTNVSKFSLTLDKPFDMPAAWPSYVPHQLCLAYLQGFAERHNLRPHIRFRHRVTKCEWEKEAQRWAVHYSRADTDEEGVSHFSDVIVATGQNSRNSAAYPQQLLAQAKASGLLTRHTSEYTDGEDFRGKRVLVLGLGISGAGIAALVSGVAAATYVAVRTPQYVMPQWLFGKPLDEATHGDLPDVSHLPRWLTTALLWVGKKVVAGIEYVLGGKTVALGMRRPLHSLLDKGAVATDAGFEKAVLAKRVLLRPEVIGFAPGRALYSSQPASAVLKPVAGDDIDAVIFATGYNWTFPFLPSSLLPSTCTPSVVDTGRRPSYCYNAPTTRASTLTLNIISPHSCHLYFMIEVVHVYSAWPIFPYQARAVVSSMEARRRGSQRAAEFDAVSGGGFANPSWSGPFYKADFWKDGDEYYVDRSLYVRFLEQYCEWIEEKGSKRVE